MNFLDIEYLKKGSANQKKIYHIIKSYKIWEILKDHKPVLVGTIPIGIDTPSSDVDIICEVNDHDHFKRLLISSYCQKSDFEVKTKELRGVISTICRFTIEDKHIEIVGQPLEPTKQVAYLHMIIEDRILNYYGLAFKKKIVELKMQGYKTEPAFAILLGLTSDPYLELLKYNLKS